MSNHGQLFKVHQGKRDGQDSEVITMYALLVATLTVEGQGHSNILQNLAWYHLKHGNVRNGQALFTSLEKELQSEILLLFYSLGLSLKIDLSYATRSTSNMYTRGLHLLRYPLP